MSRFKFWQIWDAGGFLAYITYIAHEDSAKPPCICHNWNDLRLAYHQYHKEAVLYSSVSQLTMNALCAYITSINLTKVCKHINNDGSFYIVLVFDNFH